MYDYLQWQIDVDERILLTDRNAFSRILYNLLSNACKYNTSSGFIRIETRGDALHLVNSSHGIKDPSRVFERFYKESERGLGIGLHIVQALCEQLDIRTDLSVEKTAIGKTAVEKTTVKVTLQLSKVTLN